MKEFFEKIVAWVKEHPLLALGIAGGIGLLIYLGLRNGWFGGGGSGEAASAISPLPDGGATAGGGGGEAGLPDQTAIGQSPNPIPVDIPPLKIGGTGGGAGGSGGAGGGGNNDGGYSQDTKKIFSTDNGYYDGSSVVSTSMVSLSPKVKKTRMPSTTEKIPAGTVLEVVNYSGTLPSNKNAKDASKSKTPKSKTNATRITNRNSATSYGKGKNFTGYIPGIGNFVNGVLVGTKQTVRYTAEGKPTYGW